MDKAGCKSTKAIEASMDILAQIHSSGAKVRQHFLQCNLLLLRCVSTVVNQDVDTFRTFPEITPKGSVRLVAKKDGNVVVFICLACCLDVYSVNMALFPKI